VDGTTEHCINWNVTFDFSVDETTGVINDIERGYHCLDYLKAGPSERLCFVDMNVCATKLKDDHGFSTERSAEICRDTVVCPSRLVNELGYTEERARELCPAITMGGKDCVGYKGGLCDSGVGNDWYYAATHDCSNIEPCAKSSCQKFARRHPGPERTIHVYPECTDSSQETSVEANTPPTYSPGPTPATDEPDMLGATDESDNLGETNEPVNLGETDGKTNKCLDTADWFPTRSTNGVNLFRTYFDCDCTGDLSSYYSFRCRLENYCYTDIVDGTTEHCINWNVTFDFSVDETTGVINDIERGYHCLDYLKAGPSERLCFVDMNVCATKLKDDHGFSTERSAEICRDTVVCPSRLVNELGYTEERARELCPAITMGGKDCVGYKGGLCDSGVGNDWYYAATHDCSNIEPCAKSSCQKFARRHPGPERTIHVYPECTDSSQETSVEANTPPTVSPDETPGTDESDDLGATDDPDKLGEPDKFDTLGETDVPGILGETEEADSLGETNEPGNLGKPDEPDTLGEADELNNLGELDKPDTLGDAELPDTLGETNEPYSVGEIDEPLSSGKRGAMARMAIFVVTVAAGITCHLF